jgi:hypothetical protein
MNLRVRSVMGAELSACITGKQGKSAQGHASSSNPSVLHPPHSDTEYQYSIGFFNSTDNSQQDDRKTDHDQPTFFLPSRTRGR